MTRKVTLHSQSGLYIWGELCGFVKRGYAAQTWPTK